MAQHWSSFDLALVTAEHTHAIKRPPALPGTPDDDPTIAGAAPSAADERELAISRKARAVAR